MPTVDDAVPSAIDVLVAIEDQIAGIHGISSCVPAIKTFAAAF